MISWIRHRFHPLWRLRRMAWFRELQRRCDRPVTIRNGRIRQRVLLLRDFSLIIPHRNPEARMNSLFLTLLQFSKPEFFLDVGANVGAYSWMASNFDSSIQLWLFEPDEQNIRLLRQTITANDLFLAQLIPKAVAAKDGKIEFLVDDVSGATGSVENHLANDSSLHAAYQLQKRRVVECCRLDSFLEELRGRRMVMKIDVEGAEDLVLSGGRQILEVVRPVIFIECFEPARLSLLKESGYSVLDLEEGCNWLAIPEELTEQMRTEIPDLENLPLH